MRAEGPQGPLKKLMQAASWEEHMGDLTAPRSEVAVVAAAQTMAQPKLLLRKTASFKRTLQSLKNNLMPAISESRPRTGQKKS